MSQFHLKLALSRSRAPGEDVEDELRAIHDLAIEPLAELAQLGWRQLVVEDDDIGVCFRGRLREHVNFAAAEKGGGIGPGPFLQDAKDHAGARSVRQAAELFEGMFRVDPPRPAGHQTDKRCPLHEHGTPCTHLVLDFTPHL